MSGKRGAGKKAEAAAAAAAAAPRGKAEEAEEEKRDDEFVNKGEYLILFFSFFFIFVSSFPLPYKRGLLSLRTRAWLPAANRPSLAGYLRWKAQRAEWCKSNREGDGDYDSDFLDDMDEEEIFTCLRKSRRFPVAIPLGAMVELLSVLWEDEQ